MGKTYGEIVADEIRGAGYSIGVIPYFDIEGNRDMLAADAYREDGHKYIARADSEQAAWVALKVMIWEADGL